MIKGKKLGNGRKGREGGRKRAGNSREGRKKGRMEDKRKEKIKEDNKK